jgi:hypothetical protein
MKSLQPARRLNYGVRRKKGIVKGDIESSVSHTLLRIASWDNNLTIAS